MGNISIKKATIINAVSKYSSYILNIVFTAVLARLLTPKDFGIVAIITVFTIFFSILSDMGLGTAVIQNKQLSKNDIDNIFSFSFYLAIALSLLFAILSVPISMFYGDSVYISLLCLLSISVFFNTLNMIPNALLLREKKFALVGFRTVFVTVATGVITVILALVGFKYYALIIQSILASFFSFLWNYCTVKCKLHMRPRRKSLNKIRRFSTYQFSFSIINYFSRNLDNILIGKVMGSSALAFYDKGYKLMLYPLNAFTFVISDTLQPILSDYQSQKGYIYQKYMKVVKLLSFLGLFISVFFFFSSREVVAILFGEQWMPAVPCIRFLSLSIWAQMVTSSTGSIFQSIGNTKLMFKAGSIAAVVTVLCTIIGLMSRDLTTVSIYVAVGFNFSFFINFMILVKGGFKRSFLKFLFRFIPDVAIAFIVFIAMLLFSKVYIDHVVLSLFAKLFVGLGAYMLGLTITRQWGTVMSLLRLKGAKNETHKRALS